MNEPDGTKGSEESIPDSAPRKEHQAESEVPSPEGRAESGPAPTGGSSGSKDTGGVSLRARLLVSLLLLGVLGTYGWCAYEQEYLWPFSPHPMYKGLQGKVFGTRVAVLVSPEGEVPVKSQFLPFTTSMVRANLGRTRNKKRLRTIAKALSEVYEQRRARVPNHPSYPELLGIRVYGKAWRIKSRAKNKDKPRKSLQSFLPLLPPALAQALKQEAKGTPVFGPGKEALAVSPGDVVIDLASAFGLKMVKDPAAYGGTAVELPRGATKKPKVRPRNYVDVHFNAKKGRYRVWVRGKSKKGTRADSVWLQFGGQVGTGKASSKVGFGNWRDIVPAKAYAWSSGAPGAPTRTINLSKSGKQRLRVSAREGRVLVDQIWLSKTQKEMPLSSMPRRVVGETQAVVHAPVPAAAASSTAAVSTGAVSTGAVSTGAVSTGEPVPAGVPKAAASSDRSAP